MSRDERTASADDLALQGCVRAIQQRRPDEAERIARTVLARHAQHPAALFYLGVALLAQHRAAEAIAPLEQVARIRADVAIETHLAMALRDCGRSDEALSWFERATSRQPAFAPAFKEYGATLRALLRFADAQAILRRGQQTAPAMPDLDMLLGAVCLDRADPSQAKAAFARALALVPGHPEALLGAGTVLLYEGDFAGAADRFSQILARDPGNLRARLNLGHCLIELGRWDDGIACLRAAMKVDSKAGGHVLRMLIASARGRFWLKRSAAAAFLAAAGDD